MPSFAELCFSFSAHVSFACFPRAQRGGEEIAKSKFGKFFSISFISVLEIALPALQKL